MAGPETSSRRRRRRRNNPPDCFFLVFASIIWTRHYYSARNYTEAADDEPHPHFQFVSIFTSPRIESIDN